MQTHIHTRPWDNADAVTAYVLVAMVLIWTLLMAISHSAPDLDGMEELVWAVTFEWGYTKHPPLPSWVLYGLTQILGRPIWLPFFAGMCASAAALWFLWLLAREFTTPARAAVGMLLVSTTLYFSVRGTIYNHDTAQLWSIAASIWLFYRALRHQALADWAWLGVACALATLTKYSAVVQFTAFFLFMLRHGSFRDPRNILGVGLALITFTAIFIPHLLWLVNRDFAPLHYAGNSLVSSSRLAALHSAISFVGTQFARLSPMLLAWLAWRWWHHKRPPPREHNNTNGPWSRQLSPWDKSFLLWMGLTPCLATLISASLLGTRLVAAWGTTFFILWGFYLYWVIRGNERETLKRIAVIVVTLHLFMSITYAFARGPLAWATGRPARSTFPGAEISAAIEAIWFEHVPGTPLRVVAADTWLGGNIAVNSGPQVRVFINGRRQESPWLNVESDIQCGVLVVYSFVTRRGAEPAPELLALADQAAWSGVFEQRWSSEKSPLIDLNWAIIPPSAACH